jgi:EAL domain-containing protein (putative c-di-GMP-specific phosphodiesterase class I)
MAVIDTVCDVLARAAKPVMIAANISAISLLQPAVRAHLQRAAHMGQKIRRGLLLEITETKAFSDLALASRAIGALRDMGFAVCIDDFGAGSASLDYLRHFEVDFVKIDGRFISQLGERRDAAVLRHVVALCADLGVKTIAEGVETKEVAEAARALGVDYGQGWHFGKPTATPEWTSASAASSGPLLARRRGEVEQWG